MRVYFPALSSDLGEEQISLRQAFVAVPSPDMGGEDVEVLEDDAQVEAALASLILLRDAPTHAYARIVLAADIQTDAVPSGTGVREVNNVRCDWNDVVAILADDGETSEQVRRVIEADDQDQADHAISDLWEFPLQWFDVSERDALREILK